MEGGAAHLVLHRSGGGYGGGVRGVEQLAGLQVAPHHGGEVERGVVPLPREAGWVDGERVEGRAWKVRGSGLCVWIELLSSSRSGARSGAAQAERAHRVCLLRQLGVLAQQPLHLREVGGGLGIQLKFVQAIKRHPPA